MSHRLFAFEDESVRKITSWRWDFGVGTNATEQHPIHTYARPGQ